MNCSAFKENVWAYALDALDPAERAECDRHLADGGPHEGCPAALNRAIEAAGLLGSSVAPIQPSPGVWGKIEARLDPPPSRAREPARQPRRSWFPWAVAMAAATACAIAIVIGMSYRSELRAKNAQLAQASAAAAERAQCLQELEAMRRNVDVQKQALALLELPSTKVVPLGPSAGSQTASRGSAIFNPEQQRAMVLVSALAPTVGKDYELWIIRGGDAINAGLLRPGPDGRSLVAVDPKLLQAGRPEKFAVTLEPAGGSEKPTTTPFLIGDVT